MLSGGVGLVNQSYLGGRNQPRVDLWHFLSGYIWEIKKDGAQAGWEGQVNQYITEIGGVVAQLNALGYGGLFGDPTRGPTFGVNTIVHPDRPNCLVEYWSQENGLIRWRRIDRPSDWRPNLEPAVNLAAGTAVTGAFLWALFEFLKGLPRVPVTSP
jgi:hypothetical protein